MADNTRTVALSVGVGFIVAIISNLFIRSMGRRLTLTEDIIIAAASASMEFLVTIIAIKIIAAKKIKS